MTIAILADEQLKKELLSLPLAPAIELVWADTVRALCIIEADVYFDLEYRRDSERMSQLKRLLPAPVFVNAVAETCSDLGKGFYRINAWPTMCKRNVMEIASMDDDDSAFKGIFLNLGWQYRLVPDTVGMVTPRIVSMIVNEAYFALSEGVSTREEIDTAMRLGTSYPYGPFEWANLIGTVRILELLGALNRLDPRYIIAPALLKEMNT